MSKSVSRNRSLVGRTSIPGNVISFRLRNFPAITLMVFKPHSRLSTSDYRTAPRRPLRNLKLYRIEGQAFTNEKLVHPGRSSFRNRTPHPSHIFLSAALRVADRVSLARASQRRPWSGACGNHLRLGDIARTGA